MDTPAVWSGPRVPDWGRRGGASVALGRPPPVGPPRPRCTAGNLGLASSRACMGAWQQVRDAAAKLGARPSGKGAQVRTAKASVLVAATVTPSRPGGGARPVGSEGGAAWGAMLDWLVDRAPELRRLPGGNRVHAGFFTMQLIYLFKFFLLQSQAPLAGRRLRWRRAQAPSQAPQAPQTPRGPPQGPSSLNRRKARTSECLWRALWQAFRFRTWYIIRLLRAGAGMGAGGDFLDLSKRGIDAG